MAVVEVDKIRNVGLISHGGAGKTSLAEAMLFVAGATERLGRADDGTTVMDYEPEEVKRKLSISTSIAPLYWDGHKVNIVDMPGYFDFMGEVRAGLRAADGVLLLVDAVAGVEVGTEIFWDYVQEYGLPVAVCVNKMDRENANFSRTVEALKAAFGRHVIPLQLPIGAEAGFRGVVDLIGMKAWVERDGSGGRDVQEMDVPAEMRAAAEEAREELVEAAAESDDDLISRYLEGEELSAEDIRAGLRKGVLQKRLVPVFCASALKVVGIKGILSGITSLLPSPADRGAISGKDPKSGEEVSREPSPSEPFSALVFKTMADPYVGRLSIFRVFSGVLRSDSHVYNANKGREERVGQIFLLKGKQQEPVDEARAGDICAVAKLQETSTGDTLCDAARPVVYPEIRFPKAVFSVAVKPKAKGDEEKISAGLGRLMEEDPTFRVERNTETLQMIMSGLGELHLDVLTDKLKRKFGVDVTTEPPKVPYKETIKSSTKVEGKHKKQTGGRGQYGHVFLELEPTDASVPFEFVDKIFGGAVPKQYIPAVEKGVREAMQEGVLAGYPVTNVRVTLYDGSYHPVDSSELAFKIASSMAFKKGCQQANPTLLEPIVKMEVIVPEQFMGDVMGDLNKKRGKILGMEPKGRNQLIRALVPLAEISRYAIDLRSITQGRGLYSIEFSHYEEVPANIAQEVIAQAKKEKEG